MKRFSPGRKDYLAKHAAWSFRQAQRHKEWKRAQRRLQSGVRLRTQGDLPASGQEVSIVCPEILDFDSNRTECVKLVNRLRAVSSGPRPTSFYVDFKPIREVTVPGVLLLAAELHRWNIVHPAFKLKPVDVVDWDPTVRSLLAQMGFFNLLDVSDEVPILIHTEKTYMPFTSRARRSPQAAHEWVEKELKKVVDGIPMTAQLVGAISEAVINVMEHAYKRQRVRRWWLSGGFDSSSKKVRVIVWDQGIGIPERIRTHESWSKLAKLFEIFDLANHAKLIEAAFAVGTTSSHKPHKGKGLSDNVRRYFDLIDNDGKIRVLSRRGEFGYKRNNGRVDQMSANHLSDLHGTLVEWEFVL